MIQIPYYVKNKKNKKLQIQSLSRRNVKLLDSLVIDSKSLYFN
jgi:hypothetical protein